MSLTMQISQLKSNIIKHSSGELRVGKCSSSPTEATVLLKAKDLDLIALLNVDRRQNHRKYLFNLS